MSKVKVLYVRNLTQDITEEALKEEFEHFGNVERVKKIKDYAFVHFDDRDAAVKAMQELDGKDLGGSRLEVSLAKPPSDKKKKEEILRARERRMMQMIHGRSGFDWCGCSPPHAGRGRTPQQAPRPQHSRPDYDYDYDYYGYGDYRGGYNEPFYRYDEFYFDYAGPPQPSAVRQPSNRPQPGGSCGTGGRWARRGAAAGARGGARRAARGRRTPSATPGNPRANPSLPGKRKHDGGHENQGGESKRRLGAAAACEWGPPAAAS